MFVWHAIWDSSSGQLHIWAESSELIKKQSARAKKRAREFNPWLHPFMLPTSEIAMTLRPLIPRTLTNQGQASSLILRLPSIAESPLPSPEVLADAASTEEPALASWRVETLAFQPRHALDLLLAWPYTLPVGHVTGSDLRFWQRMVLFAQILLLRQSFVPVLQYTPGSDHGDAYWQLELSEGEREQVRLFAEHMPPVCWSFFEPEEQVTSRVLQDCILDFLQRGIDAFIRGSLSQQTLFTRSAAPTLPERWLTALTSSHHTIMENAEILQVFAKKLQRWLAPNEAATAQRSFRTCFKVEPPTEGGDDAWTIQFFLQARHDPSLLLPAEQIWQESSTTLHWLTHTIEQPQELLLQDLGRAARLFPRLEQGLKVAHPLQVTVTTQEAYQFLRQAVPLLEASGFGVLVPSWWKKPIRLGARLRIKPKENINMSSGLLGMNSLVEYDWTLAIGDADLTLAEFRQLAAMKLPLVNIRGQWVELRPEEVEKALTFFKRQARQTDITLGEALKVGLTEDVGESGLPLVELSAQGWIQELIERLEQRATIPQISTPVTFLGQLRQYQERGVSWLTFLRLCGFGACLADDMGMGKTIQLIAYILHQREVGGDASRPNLIVCPMSVVGNWYHELQRFAPSLSVMIHHGSERLSGKEFLAQVDAYAIVITTYTLALRDREHLAAVPWETLVLDEAQNIKNESAKQTQAIKTLQATHKIALTGTPVENRLQELWSIMDFLNAGYLGSGADFRKRFALPIELYHDAERSNVLQRLIQPFVLRRLKTDKAIIQDLPEKMEMKVFCNLTREQASLYEAVVQDMMEKIDQAEGIERRGLILAALTRLKQVCNHPAQFLDDHSQLVNRSGKLERLREMLEEVLAEGDKALIFTQYAEMGGLLHQYLQDTLGVETLFLHGGTPKKRRDLFIQRFQQEQRGVPLFVLSLKAGGVGLNLTAANHVFHYDRWWNPAVENQATDRAFRIGQQKHVQVHKFICSGTLEERIDQLIEQKRDLAERIVGSGENWLTELSTDQLKELFALDRFAIIE
ncbi:DEAD/DEAH box helicase [Dictyobacter aurantiacus]|uniref:Helicase n=1 Tax=Dictyobacter aurantiacus TaxID=1936993 RepID=A0A401Z7Y6_9CHLR|nr:DEAD/DEAH box helicase [Dictyobacter aurantiacus]GCE02980.1 helicase [Dictyobacter aurantiacus]